MDRKDLQELSKVRLKEATALLKLGLFDGAYYLAGYAVECALKACIAKGTQRGEFPDRKRWSPVTLTTCGNWSGLPVSKKRASNWSARTRTSEPIEKLFSPGLSRADTEGIVRNPRKRCWGQLATGDTGLSHG